MGRRDPRANRIARQEMQRLCILIVNSVFDEPLPFGRLESQEVPPTITQVMSAVHDHRRAREATDQFIWDLIAAAKMAGASHHQIAEATGLGPTTIKARLSIRPAAEACGDDYIRAENDDGTRVWRFQPSG